MPTLDDLLSKRRRGALTHAERRRLDSARRASCDYELAALAQDAFERDGTPEPGDTERVRELVAAVERRLPPLSRSPVRWRAALRRAAPALFVAGAAAASIGELLPSAPPAPAAPIVAPVRGDAASRVVPAASEAPPHLLAPPHSLLPPSEAPPLERLENESPRPAARKAIPPHQQLPLPLLTAPRTSQPLRSPQPASVASPVADESAQSLFRRANRLRPVDWPAAAALYGELIRRFPSSEEAGVAEVALGKWALAQGRSGDALEWFRAHRGRAPGALTADALFGEARALESIGSHVEARGPWRQLLERYPTSPYANVARQRLGP